MRSAACIFFKRRGAAAAYAHTHNTLLLRSSTTAHQHALDAEVAELGLLRARQHARAVAARLVKVGLDGRPVVGDRAKRDGAVAHHDVDVDLGPVEVLLCACVCVRVCVGGDVVGVLGLGLCAIHDARHTTHARPVHAPHTRAHATRTRATRAPSHAPLTRATHLLEHELHADKLAGVAAVRVAVLALDERAGDDLRDALGCRRCCVVRGVGSSGARVS